MKSNIHKRNKKDQPGLFEKESLSYNGKNRTVEEPAKGSRPAGYALMYCDGASSGNPGESGIGVVISLSDSDAQLPGKNKICKISEYIGVATNNVAEYSALIKGLEKAKSLGIRKIKVFLDSELLVRQMNGIYKVKNKNLMSLWIQAKNILGDFDSYKITHVRREMNKEADSLARKGTTKKRLKQS
jgi:ribonuclease HI